MTREIPFIYEKTPKYYRQKGAFVVFLPPHIETKSSLLNSLSSSFGFPKYFGFNWDALFDLFRDFSWISARNIVLVHVDLPNLSPEEMKIYLRLLSDSVHDWRPDETHRFDVVFSEADKENIERLL
ncbi:barstar family protein [Gluconacetobacter asukensis]|uniref:Barstar family protein n=1 Tax=Gluconacetobacter asukensis TaxID=1017181 RepID=A0A7W4J446_9PROT|nr:barstar family protein [Gluconacetobacter asukensis]MBB2174276.1 barstar family protein [Gluconacetobacter asukensis]